MGLFSLQKRSQPPDTVETVRTNPTVDLEITCKYGVVSLLVNDDWLSAGIRLPEGIQMTLVSGKKYIPEEGDGLDLEIHAYETLIDVLGPYLLQLQERARQSETDELIIPDISQGVRDAFTMILKGILVIRELLCLRSPFIDARANQHEETIQLFIALLERSSAEIKALQEHYGSLTTLTPTTRTEVLLQKMGHAAHMLRCCAQAITRERASIRRFIS